MIIRQFKSNNVNCNVVFESVISSLITDFGTFLSVTLAFWINHVFIGSKFLSGILFVFWIFWLIETSTKKSIKYENKDDFIKDIEDNLKRS